MWTKSCRLTPLILAVLAAYTTQASSAAPTDDERLSAQVKELFRTRCFECHGGSATNAGVKILDRQLLVDAKKKVVPGKPDESPLWKLITAEDDTVMPPEGQPRLSTDDVALVRKWIVAGAPAFQADVARPSEPAKDPALAQVVGVDYVLKQILRHVRSLPSDRIPFVRYFSSNHLLTGGATREELQLQHAALVKTINHLSLAPTLGAATPIDAPTNTVFCVDLRELEWHKQPFEIIRQGQPATRSKLNVFDLALLDYPYAAVYEDSDTADLLQREFAAVAGLVRPIVYVRSDWFVSVATQPPLYEDFLQLPHTLEELEQRLNVSTATNVQSGIARRAGMSVSGVSRNNRVVERHPIGAGYYWKSFDYSNSKGKQNMFQDPVNLSAAGGEMIFSLPNGFQAYFVCDAKGDRVAAAPTEIVTDKFAEDKTVRNGLSCIRCHDRGMKTFADNVRPAVEKLPGSPGFSKREVLQLYPPHDDMDKLVQLDGDRFIRTLTSALGGDPAREPVTAVSQRFLDAPLQRTTAGAELGLADAAGLEHVFRSPKFTSLGLVPLASFGVARRDLWEDYYDQVVRQMGLGIPVVPLDGQIRQDYPSETPAFEVELKTNKKNNLFAPGDDLTITVANKSNKDLHIELIGTSAKGRKVLLAPAVTLVKAGAEFRFPSEGAIKIQPSLGKESITLFACDVPFPAGELLRGKNLADRVVHPFYALESKGGEFKLAFDPARIVKRTIEIDTR